MAKPGQVIKSRDVTIEFLETSATTEGKRLSFKQTMSPSAAAPPLHLHPEQHERFTVLSGQLAVRLGKTWSVLGPGQSVVVPPGVPHTLKNGGQAPAVITVELFPSRQMETFFETIFGLDAEGRLPPHGVPDLRQIALTFLAHDNVLASVPRWLYQPAARVLAWLGRRAGLRAWYSKYSPHGGPP